MSTSDISPTPKNKIERRKIKTPKKNGHKSEGTGTQGQEKEKEKEHEGEDAG
jgi:hypothetical protein